MIFKRLRSGKEVNDDEFDVVYSKRLQKASKFHFTPVEVAKKAAKFLVSHSGTKVLDVGSGAGKFCMVGAACTDGFFTGVEQRISLNKLANKLSKNPQLINTRFIHSNIMEIDFRDYDAIYYFNSFYEHIFQNSALDKELELNTSFYLLYSNYMNKQLKLMPIGTRLVTYFSFNDEIPDCYKIQSLDFDDKLKFWKKVA